MEWTRGGRPSGRPGEPVCGNRRLAVAPLVALRAALPAGFPQQPLARINVDLVQVEVVVTDAKGNRVRGLEAADLEVFENGQPRRIAHFSFIPEPPREAAAPVGTAPLAQGPARVSPAAPKRRGETVAYTVQILNAGPGGVVVRAVLLRGGKELGASGVLKVDGQGRLAGDSFRLGSGLAAGDYTLRLTARQGGATAVQFADFEVTE